MAKAEIIREWAISKAGCPYIFAANGQKCTPAYREKQMKSKPDYATNIKKNCPVLSGKQVTCDGCKYKDKPSYDCSGLTKEAGKLVGLALPHGASSQWKGDYWDEKGTIDQMPWDEVCFVYNEMQTADPMGHVGIYLGNGTVVDARGHASGVIHSPLSSYPWDHFGILKGMNEEGGEIVSEPSYLTIHCKGFAVEKLQNLLNNAGFNCGTVDGIFGSKTEAAVKQLQAANHLPESGIVDEATQKALEAAQAVIDPNASAKALAQQVYNLIKGYL
jgi:hypothetical protein